MLISVSKYFLLFMTVFIMFSCDKKRDDSQKTLRLNFSSPVPTYHPCKSGDMSSITVCKSLFEGLVRTNKKKEIELALAKDMKISPDRKTYTFTLKESKWSNGEKVTAYHFLNCWKQGLSPASFQKKHLYSIKNARAFCEGKVSFEEVGIKVIDDETIQIELDYPNPFFLEILTNHVYSPLYEMDMNQELTVFNGPYIIEKYDINKGISLIKNPFYWDLESIKIERINISFIRNINTAISLYEKGKLDWIGDPFCSIPIESISSHPEIKSKTIFSPFWIYCNTKNQKLSSSKIRRALYLCLNHDEMIKNIMLYQEKMDSIFPKSMSNLGVKSVLEDGFRETKSGTIHKQKTPLELFEEGLKEIGMISEDFILRFPYKDAPDFERIAVYLKDVWEKTFNIRVELQKEDWNTFCARIKSGNYEVGGFYMISVVKHPFYLLDFFERSDKNYSFWESKDYQICFELAKYASSEEELQFHMKKAERLLMEEMPVIPICNWSLLYLSNSHLKGFEPPDTIYSDFRYAYFDD